MVHKLAVDDDFVHQLLGQAFQPFALVRRPVVLGEDAVHGLGHALFFGFASALLGISGFESSANYVEEQAPGVFPKTLRNMWIAVTAINPLMALLALALLPVPPGDAGPTKTLLADMGTLAGGRWLQGIVAVDAVLVLSGAVLTTLRMLKKSALGTGPADGC